MTEVTAVTVALLREPYDPKPLPGDLRGTMENNRHCRHYRDRAEVTVKWE
jgi:hypothetical protein